MAKDGWSKHIILTKFTPCKSYVVELHLTEDSHTIEIYKMMGMVGGQEFVELTALPMGTIGEAKKSAARWFKKHKQSCILCNKDK